MTGPVRFAREGRIARLTLDRPAQRNAMSADLVAALIDRITDLEHDEGIGAIILTGAGAGFCAGSDIAGLAAMDAAGRRRFEADSGRVARMIAQCSKPVIAAVHGFAIGGGLTLAAACDIVVTDPGTRWSLPEVPIGLFPAWGIAAVARRTGVPTARRLCWGIDVWSGADAATAGLADLVSEAVETEAVALATKLAALPLEQAQSVKRYFAYGFADEDADGRALDHFMASTATPEAGASFQKYGKRLA